MGDKGKKPKKIRKKCPLAKISLIVSRLDFNRAVPAHIGVILTDTSNLIARDYNSFQMWVNSSPF